MLTKQWSIRTHTSTNLGEETVKLRMALFIDLAYFKRPIELGVATVGGLAFAVIVFRVLLSECDNIRVFDGDETQCGKASKWMILCHYVTTNKE